jgi:hypothetical protein
MPQMRALGKYGGEIQIGGLVLGTWLQVAEEVEFYAAIEPTLVALRDQTALHDRYERRITRSEHVHVLETVRA